MIGLAGAGHWVAAARAIAGSAIDRAAIDTAGFRFARVAAFDNPDFLPGGAKYNDLPGMIALSAPNPLWLAGEGDTPAADHLRRLPRRRSPGEHNLLFRRCRRKESAAVEWLLRQVEDATR